MTLAAPWYVRNWIRTGSPLFPFYLEIWPAQAPGWDLERSTLYQTLFSLYGDVSGPLDYVWSPIRLAVSAQPDQPAFYDGVLGIAFILALPGLAWSLWRRRLDVELRLAVVVSAGLFLFWLFSSQQLRYLLPAAAGLAVAIAVAGSDGMLHEVSTSIGGSDLVQLSFPNLPNLFNGFCSAIPASGTPCILNSVLVRP